MKSKPLTCVFSSPPSWEGMRTLCKGCRAIWICADRLEKEEAKKPRLLDMVAKYDPYGRGNNIIHKAKPRQERDEDIIIWRYNSACGAKIPKKNPYAHSATQWRFVTCPDCLKTRKV